MLGCNCEDAVPDGEDGSLVRPFRLVSASQPAIVEEENLSLSPVANRLSYDDVMDMC
jgi:hypothetical protein